MSLKIRSILVVEDNPTNQILIKQQLDYLGFQVKVVDNGVSAIENIASDDFDVVLTDINMPEMDGYEFTRKVRSSEDTRFSELPIIAITANATKDDEEKCLSAGMNGYITKPIVLENLQSIFSRLENPENEQIIKLDGAAKAIKKTQDAGGAILDTTALSNFVGGHAKLILDLLDKFVDQTSEIIRDIHLGCNNNDMKKVVFNAHKLKSSARSVGAHRLADLCVAMEASAKRGEKNSVKEIDGLLDNTLTETKAAIFSLGN